MLRALLVFCLVSIAAPALAQEYQSKELADAARDWRRELIESVPANKKQPALIAGWRRMADADYQAKRYAAAIEELTRAIANGADDGLVWLRLAQNELAAEDSHAMASAYNAYLKSADPVERGVALFRHRSRLRPPRQAKRGARRVRGRPCVRPIILDCRARRGAAPARHVPRDQSRGPGRSGTGARLPQVRRDRRA